jgi:DNA-binding NtrC family response regulator
MSAEVTRTILSNDIERLTTRTFTLEVIEGTDAGKRLVTKERVTRIGTHPDCELALDDGTTSRFHARIEVDPAGHRLLDEESKNGTFVNDLRANDVYLRPGARVRIGGNVIRYQPGDEEVQIELSRQHRFGQMLGKSAAMREIFAILERVAPTDMTVLIEGESGTGKELVADALHARSKRAGAPLVVFDCSAVAPNLIESELFGHVKGAFTGASAARAGAFERADGGTLFLDEIGELPLDLQPKLLRALEKRVVTPVGGDRPVKADVRIVAATNRNLQKEVEDATFRQDLYYRLAVIRVVLPPLRRRVEDIPLLVRHFLEDIDAPEGQRVQVGYDTIVKLQRHRWPGNVRELRNFVERAAMLATDNRLETRYLMPPSFGDTQSKVDAPDAAPVADSGVEAALAGLEEDLPFKDAKARLVEAFERAYWTRLLDRTRGNISAAARVAGIHRKSAEYLLKKLDLRRDGDAGEDDDDA